MARGVGPPSSAGYSPELEHQAQEWIEAVTREHFEGEFAEELRDGRRLCLLINEIRPGSVRRVNNSKMPFKQMENVSNFLKACRAVGVPEYSLFETVDLFELKDLGLVVKCLHALGGTAQLTCPDFQGPHLGLKPVQKSPPKKTNAAPAKKWTTSSTAYIPEPRQAPSPSCAPTMPWRGGNASATISRSDNPTSALRARATAPSARSDEMPLLSTFDESAPSATVAAEESNLPPPPAFNESATRWDKDPAEDEGGDGDSDEGLPPPPPYQERTAVKAVTPSAAPSAVPWAGPDSLSDDFSETVNIADDNGRPGNIITSPTGDGDGGRQHEPGGSKRASGSPRKIPTPVTTKSSTMSVSAASTKSVSPPRSGAPSAASLSPQSAASGSVSQQHQHNFAAAQQVSPVTKASRGGGYGLDAELAAKREANYDYESEAEAQEWIEAVTGKPFADEFGEELRNGRRLCILINQIRPGTVRKVNDSKMPFKQMENISNFLKACRAVGVAEYSLFETVDLFEQKDLGLVVRCVHALGQTVQKSCPDFDGPRLGIKQTDANKREWTQQQQEEQRRSSSGAMTQLMAGSSATMERSSIIKEGATFGASTSGTGISAEPARWTMGSQATMERSNIVKSGPTFGADYAGTGDRNSVSKVTQGFR